MKVYFIILRIVCVCATLELLSRLRSKQGLTQAKNVVVEFSPTTISSMQTVEVSWRGIPRDELNRPVTERLCYQDAHCKTVNLSVWIGVFAKDGSQVTAPRATGPQGLPAEPPWLDPSPIKWKPINSTSGKTNFVLHHHRSELFFVLFTNGTTRPVPLKVVQKVLKFEDKDVPNHFHIAQGRKKGSVVVMFETSRRIVGMQVLWGLSSSALSKSVVTSFTSFRREHLSGAPAATVGFIRQPYFHYAELRDLPPETMIYYQVGTEKGGYSKIRSFRTPKAPRAHSKLKVVAFADMGVTYEDGSQYHWEEPVAASTLKGGMKAWQRIVSKDTAHQEADLVLLIGDLSYATGYQSKWDYFMTAIEPLASKVPFMTAYGNHEQDCPNSTTFFTLNDSGGECGLPTKSRFRMPTGAQQHGWYSFEQGPVHFLIMNTEMDASPGTPQYKFILNDLRSVNRSVTPWVVFGGHRPMYSSPYTHGFINLRAGWWKPLEDLLLRFQVDLCLYGHVHNAELTCPMYRGQCMNKPAGRYPGPVHAIIGNAGQSLTPFFKNLPAWSKWRYSGFGFSTLEANSTSLTLSFYDANATANLLHTMELNRNWR